MESIPTCSRISSDSEESIDEYHDALVEPDVGVYTMLVIDGFREMSWQ